MESWQDFFTAAEEISTRAILIGLVIGSFKGWVVWKWQYDALKADAQEWKTLALQGSSLAREAVSIAGQK